MTAVGMGGLEFDPPDQPREPTSGLSALVHLGLAAGHPICGLQQLQAWVHSPIANRHTLG